MATAQITTTAGNVLKACEEALAWATKRRDAFNAEYNRQVDECKQRRATYRENVNHQYRLDYTRDWYEWTNLMWFERRRRPKPVLRQLPEEYVTDESNFTLLRDALHFEYDMTEVSKVIRTATLWQETLKWVSPDSGWSWTKLPLTRLGWE